MATMRERYLQTLRFEPADPPFALPSWPWQETAEQWRTQGWDGRPMNEVFGTDLLPNAGPYYGPAPRVPYQVLEEDERTITYVNHEGIVMRELKEHRDTSMPQFVKFPVENAADFERFAAQYLQLNTNARLTPEWHAGVARLHASEFPRTCNADRWGGFFGPLRNLMGLENLCVAFYEQPALIERMMEQRADSIIAITAETMRYTDFDAFWFWEDMAYNHASLINPALFRRTALPHYRRVVDWLRAHGVQHIWLDSDGRIDELVPIWLDAGISGLWPFESAAGMDVLQVRKKYGHALCIGGGIDKRAVAQGGAAMRAAVDRVMPLVADGGYIPEVDHAMPPDVTWARMCEYMAYLKLRMGRG
jgi:hypothetical protein